MINLPTLLTNYYNVQSYRDVTGKHIPQTKESIRSKAPKVHRCLQVLVHDKALPFAGTYAERDQCY